MKLSDLKNQHQTSRIDLEGRTSIKTEELVKMNKPLTVIDYSLFQGDHGDTAIVIYKELPENFSFANNILTDLLKQVHADAEADAELHSKGMQVKYSQRKNKAGTRTYNNVELV